MSRNPKHTRLFDWMVKHRVVTFIAMTVSFVVFGVLSVNLATYVSANATYLITYRWDAIVEGGGRQMIEVWVSALGASGAYLLFKLCETALIQRVAYTRQEQPGERAS